MRRLKPQEKKCVGEFRLIRGVDQEVNFSRFMKHFERLKRKAYAGASFMGKYRLRNRRSRNIARLAAVRSQCVQQLRARAGSIALPGEEISSRPALCLAASHDE